MQIKIFVLFSHCLHACINIVQRICKFVQIKHLLCASPIVYTINDGIALLCRGIKHGLNHEWGRRDCNNKQGFAGKQYNMCRRNLPIMKFVREAVERTREECIFQMQERRWNCSSIYKAPSFKNDLKRGRLLLSIWC